MKYVYIKDGIITCYGKTRSKDHADHTEYKVQDDFDFTKVMEDGAKLEGFLTGAEFLERYNADYTARRSNAYPSLEDQMDKIYHEGVDSWKAEIQAIKNDFPKPS